MKCIIKVQSISDVITNSSSEVFIVTEDSGLGDKITESWLRDGWNSDIVCDVCDLVYSDEDWEDWEAFYEKHKEIIDEKLLGTYFVEISDHDYSELNDYDEACQNMRNYGCIWSESWR